MVTMTDVGETSKGLDQPVEVKKNEKHYPTLFLSTKQLPELKGMKPGDTGVLKVEYEVKGVSLRSTTDKEEVGNYDIEIRKIGVSDKVPEGQDQKETNVLKEDAKKRLNAGRNY